MDTVIIYDIVDDVLRCKVARTLQEFGCVRIQKSAFYGVLDRCMREGLKVRLRKLMQGMDGNIQLYPLCKRCYSMKENIGEGYEIKDEDLLVF
jgi:CRISPR-associated protein Cas2